MKPELRNLFDDVFDEAGNCAGRAATLRAGGRVLWRRRAKRAAGRTLGLLAVAGLAVLVFHHPRPAPLAAPTASPSAAANLPKVEYLTDAELLALFPNTPVGLITTPDGHKRLIFPRPGDEEKFVTRL